MGQVAREQGLLARLHLLQGLDEACLVREEHDTMVVGVAIRIQRVELLEEQVLADAHQCPVLAGNLVPIHRQVLVLPRRSDVVEGRNLTQIRVRAGLRFRILWSVALKELGIAILRHQVQAAVPELLEQRGRALHTRISAGWSIRADFFVRSIVHDALQLWEVGALQPEAVFRDDEAKLVARSLDLELHHQGLHWPHTPKLVWQVQVALLCDGECGKPLGEERNLPRVWLPRDLRDSVRRPLLLMGVPPGDGGVLPHEAVTGYLVLNLARLHRDGGACCGVVGAGVWQLHQLLPGRRDLADSPPLYPLAERGDGEQVHTDHAAHGHLRGVLAVSTVVCRVQCTHANAVAHGLEGNGLRKVQPHLDLRVVDLLVAEPLALQVAPEADLDVVVLRAP
mmetsp:Transcript_49343/g.127293  ORF Transcript_49343/g.127293 Transcript_49343/m.127293 type:complete len:395 (-) Transcript_49343:672-1856(-)